jgi:hypothetical protein
VTLKVEWIDSGLDPKQKPNPKFPDGIDLDVSGGVEPWCKVKLPYPAKRIGHYYVECDICGTNALITTAGRSDDPRSITLPCNRKLDA